MMIVVKFLRIEQDAYSVHFSLQTGARYAGQ